MRRPTTYRTQAAAGLIAVLASYGCHHRHDPTTGGSGTTVVEGPNCGAWHFPKTTASNPLFQLAAFVGGGGGSCDSDECGLNGMWFGEGVGFREIHLGGAPNHEGLRLTGVSAPPRSPAAGRDLVLAIDKDAMALRDRTSGAVMVPTLRLAGTKIILTWDGHFVGKDQRVPVTFTLEILEVMRPAFWDCRPGAPCETGFKYRFSAITNADGGCNVEVCNPSLAHSTDPDASIAGTAVAFIGDVYDDTGFKVHSREASPRCTADQVPAGQDDVINFACSGTTLSKLYLMRHTTASRPAARQVPVSQRQALLRMLTADYCGTGETFTHNGVPLAFGARGWPGFAHYDIAATQPLEAVWSDKGAVCLDQPRLPEHTQAEIAGHCPVPACPAAQPDPSLLTPPPPPPATGCDDASGHYLMSATP